MNSKNRMRLQFEYDLRVCELAPTPVVLGGSCELAPSLAAVALYEHSSG